MKKILIIIVLFTVFLSSDVVAQSTKTLHIQQNGYECPSAYVESKGVVYYQDFIGIFLKLADSQAERLIVQSETGEVVRNIDVKNGQANFELPKKAGKYRFLIKDRCGRDEILMEVTADQRIQSEIIELQDHLFSAIADYLKPGEIPLPEEYYAFVMALDFIPYMERLDFVQQFFFKNQPLPRLGQGEWPELEKDLLDGCNCTFLQNTTRDINPAVIDDEMGFIFPFQDSLLNPQAYNNDSGWSWWRNNIGPAKGHHLTSGGYLAGATYREESFNMLLGEDFDEETDVVSPHMAEIQYILSCTRGRVEVSCDCTKRIIFDYAYETTLSATTKLRGALDLSSKRAIAMTQDVAVATLEKAGEFRVLSAGDARREARCNADQNEEFWANAAEVAISLALILLNDEDALPLSPSDSSIIVGNLITQVTDLITTPYWTENACEGSTNATPFTLIDTFEEVPFEPNERVIFRLNSFSNQLVGGKRGWLSNSDITSDFFITAVVKGTVLEGELDCCTDQMGIWLLGACDGSNWEFPVNPASDTDKLRERVGAVLGLFGPWEGLPTVGNGFNNLVIKTDMGVTLSRTDCGYDDGKYIRPGFTADNVSNLIIIDDNETEELDSDDEKIKTETSVSSYSDMPQFPYSRIEVFSLSGQLLYSGELSEDNEYSMRELLRTASANWPGSIYILRLSSETGEWESRKLTILK